MITPTHPPLTPDSTVADHKGLVALMALMADPAAAQKRRDEIAGDIARFQDIHTQALAAQQSADARANDVSRLATQAAAKMAEAAAYAKALDQKFEARDAARVAELDRAYAARLTAADEREAGLNKREASVNDREITVKSREDALRSESQSALAALERRKKDFETSANVASAALDKRAAALAEKEATLAAAQEEHRALTTSNDAMRKSIAQKRAALEALAATE